MLTPKTGNPVTKWFDKDSGLQLKMRVKANSAMGEIEADSVIGDYRKEGEFSYRTRWFSKSPRWRSR